MHIVLTWNLFNIIIFPQNRTRQWVIVKFKQLMCMFIAEAFTVGVAFIYIYKRIVVKNWMKSSDFGSCKWFCIICLLMHNLNRNIKLLYLFTIHTFGNRWKINDSWENERRKIKVRFALAQCAHVIRNGMSKIRHLQTTSLSRILFINVKVRNFNINNFSNTEKCCILIY
jgi:hypothetical protein